MAANVDASQALDDLEAVLGAGSDDDGRRSEALEILRRWQWDRDLDDASRTRASGMLRLFGTDAPSAPRMALSPIAYRSGLILGATGARPNERRSSGAERRRPSAIRVGDRRRRRRLSEGTSPSPRRARRRGAASTPSSCCSSTACRISLKRGPAGSRSRSGRGRAPAAGGFICSRRRGAPAGAAELVVAQVAVATPSRRCARARAARRCRPRRGSGAACCAASAARCTRRRWLRTR